MEQACVRGAFLLERLASVFVGEMAGESSGWVIRPSEPRAALDCLLMDAILGRHYYHDPL
jgi:hypothetical protein